MYIRALLSMQKLSMLSYSKTNAKQFWRVTKAPIHIIVVNVTDLLASGEL